jgi:phosphoglucomutase
VTHPFAGALLDESQLVNVAQLVGAYYDGRPDPSVPEQRVAFGTSGHRGSSLRTTFNEAHVLAITEAICRHRAAHGIDGPLFVGRDTHALSEPAHRTAVGVLAAHDIDVMIDAGSGYVPTPVVSHAILTRNRGRTAGLADGIVITPSHNPPEDGGLKYNPPHGGPADTEVTGWIEGTANALLDTAVEDVPRMTFGEAIAAPTVHRHDYLGSYVDDLPAVVDLAAIRDAGVRLGVDPLGGASVAYWRRIAERHGLDITIVNDAIDPTFRFVPADHDGRIRMDCSSPYALARLTTLRERFDVAVANDPDADRHGVVTRGAGLLNPNHFLAACVAYLFGGDRGWPAGVGIGKTLVTSSMLDRVAADLGRPLVEMPVGFKWFVDGLLHGSLGFAGEESAGASFLRCDGSVWTTDKDGLIACLLAAEMTARDGTDPGERYHRLTERFGRTAYRRVDVPATPREKAVLGQLTPDDVRITELAGEPIMDVLTRAPGNGAPIGGIKVVAEHGWFAARPSGTEDVYKIYAESLRGAEQLERILAEARAIVGQVLQGAHVGA